MSAAKSRLLRERLHDIVLGAVAAPGLAPFGLWPLALVAFALILARVGRAPSGRAAFLHGLFIGAGWFGLSLSWIVQPFLVDPLRHGWMAPFALVLIAFGMGLFWAGAAFAACRLRGGAIGFALALSLAELLRGHILTGFPWALPGHIWTGTALAQTAALTGAYGMTALTLIALAAPLSFGRLRGGVVAGLILLVAGGWSWHRLSLPMPEPRPYTLRIVQPNIEQNLKWDPEEARWNFDLLLGMTAGARGDLVIWPETAVPYLVTDPIVEAILEAGQGRPVATGIQRDEGYAAWNTLAVFGGAATATASDPGGISGGTAAADRAGGLSGTVTAALRDDAPGIGQSFDKMHLVPFGEYMPMGDLLYDWFGLRAFASQAGAGYTAGVERNLLDFGATGGRALPLICYEAIFPADLVTSERADWIIQVTNDAWFGTLTGPYQHFAQTRLRAIEQGLPLIRAANTGISAVVDARGFIAGDLAGNPALLPLGVRGVIDAGLPGAFAAPPYARMLALAGDWPLAVILGLALGGCAIFPRRRLAA